MGTFSKRTAILATALLLLVTAGLTAAGTQEPADALDAPQTLLPFDENIDYGQFANGIT